ncbi:MAG: hypothetical protein MR485_05700, partial [Mollicutes bacterium]|nr:hypothetical protein [Mollicutes bacterium]
MKKIKSLQIIFILFMFLIIATSCGYDCYIPVEKYQKLEGEEPYTEGDGTIDNPYVIDTKGKLIYLSNQTNENKGNDLYYELQADIDLEGINWNPIHYFKGYFNGNGYEISNFIIKNKYPSYKYYINFIGLFEFNDGTIERLGVINFDIILDWARRSMCPSIGGIAGTNYSVIKDCYAIGRISEICTDTVGNDSACRMAIFSIGGIAGKLSEEINTNIAEISNCYADVEVNNADNNIEIQIRCNIIANTDYLSEAKNINCAISG